jgi:hypothetical protein
MEADPYRGGSISLRPYEVEEPDAFGRHRLERLGPSAHGRGLSRRYVFS